MNKGFYSDNRRRIATHMAGGDIMLFFSGESVLVTAGGCENLSASIPATIEEIENVMAH